MFDVDQQFNIQQFIMCEDVFVHACIALSAALTQSLNGIVPDVRPPAALSNLCPAENINIMFYPNRVTILDNIVPGCRKVFIENVPGFQRL